MDKEYIDILLVEGTDGETVLVTLRERNEIGDIVQYDCGKLGRVVGKTWAGEVDGDMHKMVLKVTKYPVYAAESHWSLNWQGDVSNAPVS